MGEEIMACNHSFECIEYAEGGIDKCKECECSIPKKSLFKPKKKN